MKFRKLKATIKGASLYIEVKPYPSGAENNATDLENYLEAALEALRRERSIDEKMPEFFRGFR